MKPDALILPPFQGIKLCLQGRYKDWVEGRFALILGNMKNCPVGDQFEVSKDQLLHEESFPDGTLIRDHTMRWVNCLLGKMLAPVP